MIYWALRVPWPSSISALLLDGLLIRITGASRVIFSRSPRSFEEK